MPGLLIQVRDPNALAASKGGRVASFITSVAPESITNKIYSEMQKQFAQKLREQGVDADVQIVDPAGYRPSGMGGTEALVFVGVGAVTAGLGMLIWKWLR